LRRVRGKKVFYLSLLQKFINGQKSTLSEIKRLINENDLGTAERLSHSLKGVSANIGAVELASAAEKLEIAIRDHQAIHILDGILAALAIPFNNLISELTLKLPLEKMPKTVSVDASQLEKICSQLTEALKAGDAEAVELIDTHGDLLNSAFPTDFQKLNQDIQSYNFPTALVSLNLLVKSLQ
jgi:two-component system, sensor histidine kinase and response regulator